MIPIIQFLLLLFHTVRRFDDRLMSIIVTLYGLLMILIKIRQICNWNNYFNDIWNWMDIIGNISILLHLIDKEVYGAKMQKQNLNVIYIIMGLTTFGLLIILVENIGKNVKKSKSNT